MNWDLSSTVWRDPRTWHRTTEPSAAGGAAHAAPAPLLEVLWRRRRTLGLTILACIFLASLYLLLATPIYRSTATVYINQEEPLVFSQRQTPVMRSDEFLNTQAEVIQSAPVLARALATLQDQHLRTLAAAGHDPVLWLTRHGLAVEAMRKSDLVGISMDSPYSAEAPVIANAVVDAYMAEESHQKHAQGDAMVALLRGQRDVLINQMDRDLQDMIKLKQESGVLSFNDDRGNVVMGRTAVLANTLATFELSISDLRAELESAKSVLARPDAIHAFIEGQWLKGQQLGGKDLEDCRTQLTQMTLASAELSQLLGSANPRVKMYVADIDVLKKRIAEKEQEAVAARVQEIPDEITAAESKRRDLQGQMDQQQADGSDLNLKAAQYLRVEADRDRLQKQCDVLDGRIAEVAVNDANSGSLDAQIVDPARAEDKPVKPSKSLVLAAAGMLGWLLGVGLALMHEWTDARLQTPAEVAGSLNVSVIGSAPAGLPELNGARRRANPPALPNQPSALDRRVTPVLADAFREMCTAIQLGPARQAKTLLVSSPARGDGRSTVASQLAIGFAQAGLRTLVLDCDFRHPSQEQIFGVEGGSGLCGVLAGREKLAYAVRTTRQEDLYVIPAGLPTDETDEALHGKRYQDIMHALRGTFDRIIIDSPPLARGSSASALAGLADATLLVLRMNQSSHRQAASSLDELMAAGANVLGVVANDVAMPHHHRMLGFSRPFTGPPHPAAPLTNGNGNGNGAAVAAAVMNGQFPSRDMPQVAGRFASAPRPAPAPEPNWAQESR